MLTIKISGGQTLICFAIVWGTSNAFQSQCNGYWWYFNSGSRFSFTMSYYNTFIFIRTSACINEKQLGNISKMGNILWLKWFIDLIRVNSSIVGIDNIPITMARKNKCYMYSLIGRILYVVCCCSPAFSFMHTCTYWWKCKQLILT